MSLFPSIFCTIPAFTLYGEYVVRSFLPNVFIYLVTTGWIFDISLCENSINKLKKMSTTDGATYTTTTAVTDASRVFFKAGPYTIVPRSPGFAFCTPKILPVTKMRLNVCFNEMALFGPFVALIKGCSSYGRNGVQLTRGDG